MMFFFFLLLVVIALFAGFAKLIQLDSGYVLLSFHGYALEMSLWSALLFLLLFFVGLYLLYRVLRSFKSIWKNHKSSQRWRSQTKLSQGLYAYLEGNWPKSSKLLMNSTKASALPGLHMLIAAYAKQKAGEPAEAKKLLQKIRDNEDAAKQVSDTAVDLCHAQVLFDEGAYQSCVEECQAIINSKPKHEAAYALMAKALVEKNDRTALKDLMPQLKKHQVFDDQTMSDMEYETALDYLENAKLAGKDAYKQAWQALHKDERANQALVASYVERLVEFEEHDEAAKVLAASLKKSWNSDLARSYGLIKSKQPQQQLKQVSDWLDKYPLDANVLLSAGRVALRNELWGRALEYFKKSADIKPQSETFAELGRLSLSMGEDKKSVDYYRQALQLQDINLPDINMPQAMKQSS